MAHRERSWIDSLNPRELEIELANRGLTIPGTINEQRRRLRHFERNRIAEETQVNPNPSPRENPNDSESTISVTSETPMTQNNSSVNTRHDTPADGAAAISNPENNIQHESHVEEARRTGTVPRNNSNNVAPNNNHSNIQHPTSFANPIPQVRADSTSGGQLPQNRPVLGSEGLPPPHYDTINQFDQRNPNIPYYPHVDHASSNHRDYTPTLRSQVTPGSDLLSQNSSESHPNYEDRYYRSQITRGRDQLPQATRGNYPNFEERYPRSQTTRGFDPLPQDSYERYPDYEERYTRGNRQNRNADPLNTRTSRYVDNFETEFSRLSMRDPGGQGQARNRDNLRDENINPTRYGNRGNDDRPRVRFNPHITTDNGRPINRNGESRHVPMPYQQDYPNRRNYPNTTAQAYDIMRKWNLNFSGARGEDPDVFLRKIRSGRSMIYVRDEDLLDVLFFFLTGIAARWYDVHRDRWTSFEEFAEDCKNRFSDPDFQFELMQDIHRRTQGEYEPVADFLTCMLSMFDRLSPKLSEYEEINFAHRNLLPRLHLTIPRISIRNFVQFEQIAVAAEKSFRVAKSYQPPPRPEGSLLPDLAYRGTTTRPKHRYREPLNRMDEEPNSDEGDLEELLMINHTTNKESATTSDRSKNKANKKPSLSKGSSDKEEARSPNKEYHHNSSAPTKDMKSKDSTDRSPSFTCWNCDQTGHRHNDCKEPKNIICYGCGRKNVTKPRCPNCSGNERRSR